MNKKAHMDYSTPLTIIESGARAFNLGLSKDDCPIDGRTHANAFHWWHDGYNKEAAKTCKGINCTAKRGVGHSEECIKEHSDIVDGIEIFSGTREQLTKLKI